MTFTAQGLACSTRAALFGSAALLSLAVPGVAFAQDGAAEDDGYDEIVVTATKREQTLQDVPVAVSVTTAETIERAQIRDIRDLSTVVPSLRVNQLQSSANTNFYIRGFGNGANNAGIEPSVGLFVDGVYRSRSASMIADMPDVSRVEVLRGPQSTLFGKNASAGVISMVTRKPQFTFGGNVEASYGNYDAMVLKGVVTGPIGETMAFSLAGGLNKRDGYVKDLGTGTRENERDRWFARGQLLFTPSSALEVRLIGDYGKIDENCCAVVNLRRSAATSVITAPVPFGLGGQVNDFRTPFSDQVFYNRPSTNKITNWGLSGQIDYDMGGVKLTSITAYRRTNAVTNQDSDFTSADLLGQNYQNLRIKTFTQELRATTDWDGPLNLLAGAYYFNERIAQANQINWGAHARPYANALIQGLTGCLSGAPTCTSVPGLETTLSGLAGVNLAGTFFGNGQGMSERYRLKNEALSLFGQADFEITENLTLTGGINYTNDKKRVATSTVSNDVFAGLDFVALGQRAIIARGLINAGVNPADPAAVLAFATGAATAPFYQGILAFAAANRTNPAVNSLLGLQPLQFFPPFLNVPNAVESGKVKDSHFSYTARLAFDVSDNVNLYAGYATGYKAASINLSRDSKPSPTDLAAITAAGIGVPNLRSGSRYAGPETSSVMELGVKGNWGVASANVAVFKQTIKGFQSNIFTGTGFFLANAGKQSAFGVEFEGMARPTKELTLNLSVTYLDPKYNSFRLSAFGDLSGTTPAGVSPLSATIGAEYDRELGGGDHVILRADYHYEAPFQLVEGLPNYVGICGAACAVQAARDFKQDINQVSASLTYAMANGIEMTVWGRNLLDDRTILQIFDSPAQIGSISGYPSEPRTYGATVRYRF